MMIIEGRFMVWLIVIGSVFAFALIFTPSRKTIVRSCREFDRIVATNCEENELECKRRMKAVMEATEKEDLPSVQEAYDFIMKSSKVNNDTEHSSINSKTIPDGSLKALCLAVVEKDGRNLQFVPNELRTLELCLVAFHQNHDALMHVPEHIKNLIGVEMQTDNSLNEGLLDILTSRETLDLLTDDEFAEYLNTGDFPVKIWLTVLKKNGLFLQEVPDMLKSVELCTEAVQQNGLALQYVPDFLKSHELCLAAVQQDGDALYFVPDKLQTFELLDAVSPSEWHNQIQYGDNDEHMHSSSDDDCYERYATGEFNELGFKIEK